MLDFVFFTVWIQKHHFQNDVLEGLTKKTCLQQFIRFSSLVENLLRSHNVSQKNTDSPPPYFSSNFEVSLTQSHLSAGLVVQYHPMDKWRHLLRPSGPAASCSCQWQADLLTNEAPGLFAWVSIGLGGDVVTFCLHHW